MAAPPIELPETVRRRWGRRLHGAARDWAGATSKDVAAIVAAHAILPLVADAGGLLGLRADGVVVEVPWHAIHWASPVGDVRTRDIAVVLGARRYPELAVLRPERGPDDPDCAQCRGTGVFEPSMPSISCFCGGLGYLPSSWGTDEEDLEPTAELVAHGEASSAAAVGPARRSARVETTDEGAASVAAPGREAGSAEPARRALRAAEDEAATTDEATPNEEARPGRAGARIGTLLVSGAIALLGAAVGIAWAGSDGVTGRVELALACGIGMLPGVLGGAWLGFRDADD